MEFLLAYMINGLELDESNVKSFLGYFEWYLMRVGMQRIEIHADGQ